MISDGGFLTTHAIQDAFHAENNLSNPSIVSNSTFHKILKDYILDVFSDQSGVSCNRLYHNGKRASGYTGLALVIPGEHSANANSSIKNSGIYVLRLDSKPTPSFYVGKATDIVHRIQQHTDGEGAYCITGEPFTRIEPLTKGSVDDMESWERNEVLTRMHEFGIDNVRGWMYTLKTMPMEQKMHAFDEICEKFDFCRKCGRNSHFIRDCHSMSTDLWTGGMELRIRGSGQAATQQSALDDASRRITEAQEMIASAARVLGGGV
jgi:hypothetical protein